MLIIKRDIFKKGIIIGNQWKLLWLSFTAFFLEMACIRYTTSYVAFLSYFTNIILLSSFLGLGIGFLMHQSRYVWRGKDFVVAPKRQFLGINTFPLLFFIFTFLIGTLFNARLLTDVNYHDELFMGGAFGKFNIYIGVALIFLITSLLFIPLGQSVGKLMRGMHPLKGYSINVFGSILGIATFALLSFLNTSPFIWFMIGVIPILLFVKVQRFWIYLINVILIFLSIYSVWTLDIKFVWTPYYRIRIMPIPIPNFMRYLESYKEENIGYDIYVNDLYHQRLINYNLDYEKIASNILIPAYGDTLKVIEAFKKLTEFPYRIIKPQSVLILGAGSGFDAGYALRNGVKYIDAVEIDPQIAKLGKHLNPLHPYLRSNVKVYIDDARAFLKKNKKKYDLIVIAEIDSHRLFSKFSSIRLDSFIYTLNCFSEIKNHLTENGIFIFTHSFHWWSADRIYSMLITIFKQEPYVIAINSDKVRGLDKSYILGPGLKNLKINEDILPPNIVLINKKEFKIASILPTDNWPFFYLRAKTIPVHYRYFIAIILVITLLYLYILPRSKRKINRHFFFLGSAFMLLETSNITRFALLFGTTWIVNAIVISAILVVILLANLYASKRSVKNNIGRCYILLIISLAINFILENNNLLALNYFLRLIVASTLMGLPVFFAGIVFASSLKFTTNIPIAMGSNLLGAMVGGIFEYAALLIGFNGLIIFIAIFYILSISKVVDS